MVDMEMVVDVMDMPDVSALPMEQRCVLCMAGVKRVVGWAKPTH